MVAHANRRFVTPQEYLEQERRAEVRSEYLDGVVVAMAGSSRQHDRITGNIYAGLHAQLRGTSCEPFTSDMRVRVSACNRYFYPDVSVACEAYFEDAHVDTLMNPILVVEVLSDSTQNVDRGDKLICYQMLDTLQTYILVAQDRPLVQIYERQPDGKWVYSLVMDPEATLELTSIGCELKMTDIYARVVFPTGNTS